MVLTILSIAGDLHMSPGVLAELWKEEELKTKALEEHMKSLLSEKGVRINIINSYLTLNVSLCSIVCNFA